MKIKFKSLRKNKVYLEFSFKEDILVTIDPNFCRVDRASDYLDSLDIWIPLSKRDFNENNETVIFLKKEKIYEIFM